MALVIQVVSAMYPFGTPSHLMRDQPPSDLIWLGVKEAPSLFLHLLFQWLVFLLLQYFNKYMLLLFVWDSHRNQECKLQLGRWGSINMRWRYSGQMDKAADIILAVWRPMTNHNIRERRCQRNRCIFLFKRLQLSKCICYKTQLPLFAEHYFSP